MKKILLSSLIISTLYLSPSTLANQAGDILVRGGVTLISPDNGEAGVFVEALGGNTPLSLSVDDNIQLGLNFVYFYDNNWAIELLAATPYTHDVNIHDQEGISSGVFGVDVNGLTLAEVSQLPPTLSALYYFESNSNLKPYVGVGINYTIFFDEKFTSAPTSLGFNSLELNGSFGFSAQFGADYHLNEKWHVNTSIRYIDIDSTAIFKIGDSTQGSADVEIDPLVFSVMLGYKF